MTTKERSQRDKRVQIRVSDDIYNRLLWISQDMGIPPATLASVALSEYLIRKERERAVVKSISDDLSFHAKELFDSLKDIEE